MGEFSYVRVSSLGGHLNSQARTESRVQAFVSGKQTRKTTKNRYRPLIELLRRQSGLAWPNPRPSASLRQAIRKTLGSALQGLLLTFCLQCERAGVDYRSGAGDSLEVHLIAIDLNQHETAIGIEANSIQIA